MELVATFSKRLAEAIEDDGRSVTEIAIAANMSKQTISAYIHAKRRPKKNGLEAIARALNVSAAWLYGYDVDKFIVQSEVQQDNRLSDMEQRMLAYLRAMSSDGQQALLENAEYLASKYKRE